METRANPATSSCASSTTNEAIMAMLQEQSSALKRLQEQVDQLGATLEISPAAMGVHTIEQRIPKRLRLRASSDDDAFNDISLDPSLTKTDNHADIKAVLGMLFAQVDRNDLSQIILGILKPDINTDVSSTIEMPRLLVEDTLPTVYKIDLCKYGAKFILQILNDFCFCTKTTIKSVIEGAYKNVKVKNPYQKNNIITLLESMKVEASKYINLNMENIMKAIVPALLQSEYINMVLAKEPMFINDQKVYYHIYSITSAGVIALKNGIIPVNVYETSDLDQVLKFKKLQRERTVSILKKSGIECIGSEDPDVLEALHRYSTFIDRLNNDELYISFYAELSKVIAKWEFEFDVFFPENVKFRLLHNVSTFPDRIPITQQDLFAWGIHANVGIENLSFSVTNWKNWFLEKSQNISIPINLNTTMYIAFEEHLPNEWVHSDKDFVNGNSNWSFCYSQFVSERKTMNFIANNFVNKKGEKSNSRSSLSSIVIHLFEAYNNGNDFDYNKIGAVKPTTTNWKEYLQRIHSEYPAPTVEEWKIMEDCNTRYDVVCNKHVSYRTFMAPYMGDTCPSNKYVGENWTRVIIWYQGLKRSGYELL